MIVLNQPSKQVKFTSHPDFLKSGQTTIFTGGKDQEEKLFLGTEELSKYVQYNGQAAKMCLLNRIYLAVSSRQKLPASVADVNEPGIFTVGCGRSAKAKVLALETELPCSWEENCNWHRPALINLLPMCCQDGTGSYDVDVCQPKIGKPNQLVPGSSSMLCKITGDDLVKLMQPS